MTGIVNVSIGVLTEIQHIDKPIAPIRDAARKQKPITKYEFHFC